jgi:hypothetical protein
MAQTNAESCKRYKQKLKNERPEKYAEYLKRDSTRQRVRFTTDPEYREKRKALARAWYKKNSEKLNAKSKLYRQRIKDNKVPKSTAPSMKLKLVNYYRSKGCSQCDEKRFACLDFHHVDPSSKLFSIAAGVKDKNIHKLQWEIDKCVVLCSNCHRYHHSMGVSVSP